MAHTIESTYLKSFPTFFVEWKTNRTMIMKQCVLSYFLYKWISPLSVAMGTFYGLMLKDELMPPPVAPPAHLHLPPVAPPAQIYSPL